MSARYHERFAKIEQVLLIEHKVIDKDDLRDSCKYGMPEQLRPLAWRLLLDYLPMERANWTRHLEAQRATYDGLVQQLIVEEERRHSHDDHPLSDESCSQWGAFFADNTTLAQINKDVRRLCPEIQFFQLTTKFPHREAAMAKLSSRVTGAELESEDFAVDHFGAANFKTARKRASACYANAARDDGEETHWQVAERILFIYAKLNPGIKYVQGMNEVLGPIYYVLASDPDAEWAAHAEADAFFCFLQLMAEIKDNFIKTLDYSNCGIEHSMFHLHQLLQSFDPVLHTHLVDRLGVKPQFYAFRWLSLMLSQELPLPDVISLWDSLFADSRRFTLLPYVCLAMLERVREQLLRGDFADCLRLLQNYPETDVQQLVMEAYAMREGRASRPSTKEERGEKRMDKIIPGAITEKLRNMTILRK